MMSHPSVAFEFVSVFLFSFRLRREVTLIVAVGGADSSEKLGRPAKKIRTGDQESGHSIVPTHRDAGPSDGSLLIVL